MKKPSLLGFIRLGNPILKIAAGRRIPDTLSKSEWVKMHAKMGNRTIPVMETKGAQKSRMNEKDT